MFKRVLSMIGLAFVVINAVGCAVQADDIVVQDETTGVQVQAVERATGLIMTISDMVNGPNKEHQIFAQELRNGQPAGDVLLVNLGGLSARKGDLLQASWIKYSIHDRKDFHPRKDITVSALRHIPPAERDIHLKKGEAKKTN